MKRGFLVTQINVLGILPFIVSFVLQGKSQPRFEASLRYGDLSFLNAFRAALSLPLAQQRGEYYKESTKKQT